MLAQPFFKLAQQPLGHLGYATRCRQPADDFALALNVPLRFTNVPLDQCALNFESHL
jgi:hypothetical protein